MLKKYKLGYYSPLYLPFKLILEFTIIYFIWLFHYELSAFLVVFYLLLPFVLPNNNKLLNGNLLYHFARGHYIWNKEVKRPFIISAIRYMVLLAIIVMVAHLLSEHVIYVFYVITALYVLRMVTLVLFYKISKNAKGYNDWVIFLSNKNLWMK